MNYAINKLKDEREQIQTCLTNWEIGTYPEAKNIRYKRVKDLDDAIKILENA